MNRRERYREQTRDEVKELALAQLAEAGASGLSLNAIAKQMGLTGPALYRYFANRDALLTELIGDGYDDLARALAEAAATDGTPEQRFRATAAALRGWAVGQPHRYLLLFGTPVPGFAAPDRTTEAAQRSMRVLMELAAALDLPPGPPRTPLDDQIATWQRHMGVSPGSPAAARLALATWTRLHGILSLEVSHQFTLTGVDPALIYQAEVDALLAGVS